MRETLQEMLHRDSFVPFRIILASGTEYRIENPDLIALGQTQITLYAPRSDRFSILRLNQIASIDVVQAA